MSRGGPRQLWAGPVSQGSAGPAGEARAVILTYVYWLGGAIGRRR